MYKIKTFLDFLDLPSIGKIENHILMKFVKFQLKKLMVESQMSEPLNHQVVMDFLWNGKRV